jgi:hypothetical protein
LSVHQYFVQVAILVLVQVLLSSIDTSIAGETWRTFVVESVNDDGPGSLRWAILDANDTVNGSAPDQIVFSISGAGPHSIRLESPLPAILDPVIIDGFTQAGSSANTRLIGSDARYMVELDGSAIGFGSGLVIRSGNTTIRGLAIRGFAANGVRIHGAGSNRIEGSRIGGEVAAGGAPMNSGSGVVIVDSHDNRIGGTEPAARNEIIGNAEHGVVILGADSFANSVLGNRIVDNRRDGIAIKTAEPLTARGSQVVPNNSQQPPVLVSATRQLDQRGVSLGTLIEGHVQSSRLSACRVEIFSTHAKARLSEPGPDDAARSELPLREGDKLLSSMSVTTDADGRADFKLVVPNGVDSRAAITAIVTDAVGNSSEFSSPLEAPQVSKSWNSATGGNWGDATKWTPSGVPTAGDDAVITLAGTYTVTLNVNAQVASLTLGGSSGTQTLSMSANTLTLDGASTINSFGALTQNGGTIAGAGNLSISGPFTWGGGAQTGTGTTAVNGTLTITGGGNHDLTSSRAFNTNATTTWSSAGAVRIGSGAIVNNSGTWDSQANSTLSNPFGGTATFNNSGTFKKSAGTGNTIVASSLSAFHNSGSVLAQAGTVLLQASGTHTGNFNGSGGTVQFAVGVHDLNAGASLAGVTQLISGTLNTNAAITTATFSQSGGTLQGATAFTTTGLYTWTGGAMAGAGITNANGGMSIGGIGKELRGGRTLNNVGTATYSGSGQLGVEAGSAINNSGTWDCQSDHLYTQANGTRGTFNNLATGTFRKSGGIGETNMSLQMTNAGAVEVLTGQLICTNATTPYVQTGGSTKLQGGNMRADSTADFQGGTLTGGGTFFGRIRNSGQVAPGLPIGALNVTATYTQTASGALNVEVGGLTPATQYDQLNLTGAATATLAGTLNVSLANGFMPPELSEYSVVTYASHTGTFSSVNQPGTSCVGFTTRYDPTAVVLTFVHLPTEIHNQRIAADKRTITWGAPPPYAGTTFDVIRGRVSALPVGSQPGLENCIAQNIAATQTTDAITPSAGTSFWYLVRERVAGCGVGTYGESSAGADRISSACP